MSDRTLSTDEIEAMRAALKQYANPKWYRRTLDDVYPVLEDGGALARAALHATGAKRPRKRGGA